MAVGQGEKEEWYRKRVLMGCKLLVGGWEEACMARKQSSRLSGCLFVVGGEGGGGDVEGR